MPSGTSRARSHDTIRAGSQATPGSSNTAALKLPGPDHSPNNMPTAKRVPIASRSRSGSNMGYVVYRPAGGNRASLKGTSPPVRSWAMPSAQRTAVSSGR